MLKSVFEFSDYREYLAHFYLHHKQLGGFSYEKFAERAELGSRSFLKLVIDGKRSLTSETIFKVGQGLGHNFDEQKYFEALVWHNQATTEKQKSYHRTILAEMRAQRSTSLSKLDDPDLLDFPFILGAITLLSRARGGANVEGLAEKLRVSKNHVETFLQTLQRKGMVEQQGENYFLPSEFYLFHDRKDWKLRQKTFLLENLSKSKTSALNNYAQTKLFSQAFSGSWKRQDYYLAKINGLLESLAKESDDAADEGNELLQINVQLFPY